MRVRRSGAFRGTVSVSDVSLPDPSLDRLPPPHRSAVRRCVAFVKRRRRLRDVGTGAEREEREEVTRKERREENDEDGEVQDGEEEGLEGVAGGQATRSWPASRGSYSSTASTRRRRRVVGAQARQATRWRRCALPPDFSTSTRRPADLRHAVFRARQIRMHEESRRRGPARGEPLGEPASDPCTGTSLTIHGESELFSGDSGGGAISRRRPTRFASAARSGASESANTPPDVIALNPALTLRTRGTTIGRRER